MNIIDKRTAGRVEFSNLIIGDVFIDDESIPYMKIPECTLVNCTIVHNAVSLYSGGPAFVAPDEMVTPVKATLTIEDKI